MDKRFGLYILIICTVGALMLLNLWAPKIEKLFYAYKNIEQSMVWDHEGWQEISPTPMTLSDSIKSGQNPLTDTRDPLPVQKDKKPDSTALALEKSVPTQVFEKPHSEKASSTVITERRESASPGSIPSPEKPKSDSTASIIMAESEFENNNQTDSLNTRIAQLSDEDNSVKALDSLGQNARLEKKRGNFSTIDSLLAEILAAQDSIDNKKVNPQHTMVDSVLLAKRRNIGLELRELIYGKDKKKRVESSDPAALGLKSNNVSLAASHKESTVAESRNRSITGKSGYSSWQIGLLSGPTRHQSQANGTLGGLTSSLFLDYFVRPTIALELKVGVGPLGLSDSYTSLQTQLVRADIKLKYQIQATKRVKPFVAIGIGMDRFDAARIDSQIKPQSFSSFMAGTGVQVGVTQHLSLVLSGEFRMINGEISDNSQTNDTSTSAQIGFSYRFHKKAASEPGEKLLASKSITFP